MQAAQVCRIAVFALLEHFPQNMELCPLLSVCCAGQAHTKVEQLLQAAGRVTVECTPQAWGELVWMCALLVALASTREAQVAAHQIRFSHALMG